MTQGQEKDAPASDWLSQLRQSYSQVQLGPGVVGKTTRATLGLIAIWLLVIWRLGESWILNGSLLVAGIAATAFVWWWVRKTHSFAEANPEVALLEGAQLIEYQKWEAAVNGKTIPRTLPVSNPDEPIRIESEQ